MTRSDEPAFPLERWPGYTEQSWQERFAELDRRYCESNRRLEAAIGMIAEGEKP